jgi:hypothetical protein
MMVRISLLILLLVVACSTTPSPTPTPESSPTPSPKSVGLEIVSYEFMDELGGGYQRLVERWESATTPIERVLRRMRGELSEGPYQWAAKPGLLDGEERYFVDIPSDGFPSRCGGLVDSEGYIFEEPAMANGVFVVVFFSLTNISDSTLLLSDADFHIVDEDGVSHGVAGDATQSLVCALMYGEFPQTTSTVPTRASTTTRVSEYGRDFGGRHWEVVFQDEPVKPQATVYVQGVFDIPRTGFERSLGVSYLSEEPEPVSDKAE